MHSIWNRLIWCVGLVWLRGWPSYLFKEPVHANPQAVYASSRNEGKNQLLFLLKLERTHHKWLASKHRKSVQKSV